MLTMQPIVIPVIPALLELRAAVLMRTDKRCPKWGFRLGADLAVQLQPKPVLWRDPRDRPVRQESVRFEGLADYLSDGQVAANTFRVRPDWKLPRMRMEFLLLGYLDTPEVWSFVPGRASCAIGASALRDPLLVRLERAFTNGTFDVFRPELILRPACLCCGKALTDPASMARWIGPECAGSGALTVPRMFRTGESLFRGTESRP
jgi:Family of unknown function (DUF6011)